jgi:hypothetical protein
MGHSMAASDRSISASRKRTVEGATSEGG